MLTKQLTHRAHLDQPDFPFYDEQSPAKILDVVSTLLERSGSLQDALSVKSIQICRQMHGLVLWSSSAVLFPLITWQNQRCSMEFLA